VGTESKSDDGLTAMAKIDGGQQMKKNPQTAAFKKRHRGCSFCILDIESAAIPEFPSNEEVVGVITMEDVIEELLQVMFSSV
jgi:metal transporter CNNM